MPTWEGSGGLDLGGQGEWFTDRLTACRLVVCFDGLKSNLQLLTHRWEGHWKVGLFQSNTLPRLSLTLQDLVPCDFSGYVGELVTFSWTAPAMQGVYAVSTAHDLIWMHDGGPIGNFVFGYYVVDPDGTLVWAERFCPAPKAVGKRGLRVRVRPTFFLTNS